MPSYVQSNCGRMHGHSNLHLTAGLTCNLVMHVGILRLHAFKCAHTHTPLAQLFTKPFSYFSCCLLRPYPHAQLSHSVFLSCLHSLTHIHNQNKANRQPWHCKYGAKRNKQVVSPTVHCFLKRFVIVKICWVAMRMWRTSALKKVRHRFSIAFLQNCWAQDGQFCFFVFFLKE